MDLHRLGPRRRLAGPPPAAPRRPRPPAATRAAACRSAPSIRRADPPSAAPAAGRCDRSIRGRDSACRSSFPVRSRCTQPRTALSGVRSSCEIVAGIRPSSGAPSPSSWRASASCARSSASRRARRSSATPAVSSSPCTRKSARCIGAAACAPPSCQAPSTAPSTVAASAGPCLRTTRWPSLLWPSSIRLTAVVDPTFQPCDQRPLPPPASPAPSQSEGVPVVSETDRRRRDPMSFGSAGARSAIGSGFAAAAVAGLRLGDGFGWLGVDHESCPSTRSIRPYSRAFAASR